MGIAPTGKQVRMSGIDIFRIAEAKIVEMWNQEDVLGMMQQLGAIPERVQPEDASST
jgi:predicted ester cyclase